MTTETLTVNVLIMPDMKVESSLSESKKIFILISMEILAKDLVHFSTR